VYESTDPASSGFRHFMAKLVEQTEQYAGLVHLFMVTPISSN
jgi:hypothetical protein